MNIKILTLLIAITMLIPLSIGATQVLEIQWDDLKNNIKFDDPFAALTKDQLHDLSLYANIAAKKINNPDAVTNDMEFEAQQAEATLKKAGVDIEYLLNKRTEIMNQRKQAAYAVVPDLNGEQIRMPGYALPLEYSGQKITEFLLVPWVGACIHTPPPPPNQIVYVTIEDGFVSKGQFAPVWITGRLTVEQLSKNLYLKDGSGEIDVGYKLAASDVTPYKQ